MAEMKRKVGIVATYPDGLVLDFDAAHLDAVVKIAGVSQAYTLGGFTDRHSITIDTRYDQAEVLADIDRVVAGE